MSKKYQVYRDVAGKFRFRLLSENNQIIAVGEAYEQRDSCINGIRSIQSNCDAQIEDLTATEVMRISNPKYQVFYDEKCKWRFHLNARNGEIIAQSEGYESKQGCMNGIEAVKSSCDAEIEDLTTKQESKEVISYNQIEVPEAQVKPVEVAKEALGEVKIPEAQVVAPAAIVEPKVKIPPAVGEVKPVQIAKESIIEAAPPQVQAVAPEEVKPWVSTTPAVTVLDLQDLSMANKGELVYFKGRLYRSDTGQGIPEAKIDIWEYDRSLLGDDYLAYGKTAQDGSFNIEWKARSLAWFENTGKIYAHFKGNEQAHPSKSTIQTITIN